MNAAARSSSVLSALTMLGCILCSSTSARGQDIPPDVVRSTQARDAGGSQVLDPWERYNRRMYSFNRRLDRVLFLPVARGYQRITPPIFRQGVRNFFGNLQQPVVMVNQLLQGRPKLAAAALGRFALNTTLGIGGIFDPASEAKIPDARADFGQTLARWGWRRSRYFVLPVFGPSTIRDGAGKVLNRALSPVYWLARREGPGVSLLYGVDARASALPAEAFLNDAEDEYLLVRDTFMQFRRCQIVDCRDELPDYLLPDYQYEIPR